MNTIEPENTVQDILMEPEPEPVTDPGQNEIVEDNDNGIESESEDEKEFDDGYLQKFEAKLKTSVVDSYHPEMKVRSEAEVEVLSQIIRNEQGVIVDPFHKTMPFITKYEKARILGERARQINSGATPLVQVDAECIDGYLIALKEFENKKIPLIIKRPLPNGDCEYWRCVDLETI